ncbi:MAG: tail fiber domain-containing protein [Limisphaerales bacterium]
MKKSYNLLFLIGLLTFRSSLWAQSTAFTYQGQLATAGQPANGNYDLTFALFNASTGGRAAAGPLETDAVAISNGLFTIVLDFGSGIFDGTSYWLEIGVRTNGDSSFTTLSPRQTLTPTPYAIYAQGADATGLEGAIPTSSLSGAYDQPVTFNNTGNSFSGDGSGLTGLNASQLTGGTVPDPQLSTNVALLDGDQVFSGSNLFSGVVQLTNAANTVAGSFLGDGSGLSNLTVNAANLVGTLPATQLAGPLPASLLAGTFTNPVAFDNPANSLSGDGSGLTGVDAATLQGMAASQFLTSTGDGGDLMNLAPENISPGTANIDITGNANTANYTGTASNAPGSPFALDVKGNQTNEGGVYVNNACGLLFGGVHLGTDGGITTGGYLSVANNTRLFDIPASSQAMVEIGCDVPNGIVTYCGQPFLVHFDQVSGGYATDGNFPSGCNTFTIGKYGQVVLNNPLSQSCNIWEPEFESPQLVFQSEVLTNLGEWGPTNYWGISQVSNVFTIGPMIGINNHMNGVDAGCTRSYVEGSVLPAIVITTNGDVGIGTASPNNTLEVAGTVSATSFINSSDRNLKGGFRQVNAQEVLEAVAALPIQRWHFLRDIHTQHIGPMAQDFRAAFKVGPDDKHIDTVDAAGVALAAIQGLNQKLAEALNQKQTEITELRQRLDKLEQLLTAKSGGKKDYTRRGNDKFSVGYYVKDGAIIKKHSLLADKDDPVSNLDLDIAAKGGGFDSMIATGKETDLTLTGTISASDNGDGKNASDFSGLGVQIVASDCAKVKVHSMKIDTKDFLRAANAPVDGYVATAAGTGGATAWQQGSSGANSGTASVSVAAISNPTNSVPHSVGIQHLNPAPWMGYNN